MPKRVDLTGQIFERLEVKKLDKERMAKERAENPNNRQTYWICACECGNIKSINARELKTGKTKSCGCLSAEISSEKAEDLTGKTFGYLTVIERDWETSRGINSDGKYKGVYWHCKCICGKTVSKDSYNLKQHKNISCGCQPKNKGHYKNLAGMVCGRLTVLEIDEDKTSKSKKYYWKCRCICGNYTSVSSSSLISKNVKSCGCLIKDTMNEVHKNKALKEGSFANFLIDKYGENALDTYWDYDKNKLNPYEITKGSKKKVWIKCIDKEYHGSYEVTVANFVYDETRCPYCKSQKIHKNDSLGALYPEIMEVWSEKNEKFPYEYAPKSKQVVWFKCADGNHDDFEMSICFMTARKNLPFCPKCWREFGIYEYAKGEKNKLWKGGITSLNKHLRNTINEWKKDSFKKYDYKCCITGRTDNLVIHHVYKFSNIVQETIESLGFEIKSNIGDYQKEELDAIENKCLELHYKYGLGICLTSDIHNNFHSIYGVTNCTQEDWLEFEESFKDKEYKNVI